MTDQKIYKLLIKIDGGYQATEDDVRALASVEKIKWEGIRDLPRSMGMLKALVSFELQRTIIRDISVLSSLKRLKSLGLISTRVSDISVLSGLTKLEELDLSDNYYLNDISALSGLSNLTTVVLFKNRNLKDIEVLSGLSGLIKLDLSQNEKLEDISALYGLHNLKELDLSGDKSLIDISALSGMYSLTKLNLRETSVRNISALSNLINLTNLDLNELDLRDISALSGLTALTNLDLSWNTNLSNIDALSGLRNLTSLNLEETRVSNVNALSSMNALTNLNLFWNKKLNDISALSGLTNLSYLELSETKVDDISALSSLHKLTYLGLKNLKVSHTIDLSDKTDLIDLDLENTYVNGNIVLSKLTSLENLNLSTATVMGSISLSDVTSLKNLDLSKTSVRTIGLISGLTSLKKLDLRYLHLTELPESIIDLNLDFIADKQPHGSGIYIYGLTLSDQPIEIFSQSRDAIREQYLNRRVPINECKVVFLGDGGAGKTHAIKRLLENGKVLTDFKEKTTPGIEITVDQAPLKDSEVVINYWDFGGQEMLHSMHRMFLTERTLYVIFVNARENIQDERAKYWLHNVKSFAKEAPVLLVINQIDLNPNASVNEKNLKENYGQLKAIVKMSALEDTPEEFNKHLRDNIFSIIKEMKSVQAQIPRSWKKVMENVRQRRRDYLKLDQFAKICRDSKVSNYDNVRDDIISWLQILGISFRYKEGRDTAYQLLLNPKWLVNAIYIILFNGGRFAHNGILSHAELYNLLENEKIDGYKIKRVLPDIRYKDEEVNYILGVIRNFKLSYQLGAQEFFPMLCTRDEKLSPSEAVEGEVLHFIFKYEYLPENVLHWLIVDMRRDLDEKNVWFTGAVFHNKERSQTAYVRKTDNDLHIYVCGKNWFYNPNEYLMPIRDNIHEINEYMGLAAKEFVIYNEDGKDQDFSYNMLVRSVLNGKRDVFSENHDKSIDIKEQILARYDGDIKEQRYNLMRSIFDSLTKLQNNREYYSSNEVSRNTYVRDLLEMAGFICKDETRGGISVSGNESGELDIRIESKEGKVLTIYEALNLRGFSQTSKRYLDKHIDKLLNNYNSMGLSFLFLVSYMDCKKEKFQELAFKYMDYIQGESVVSFDTSGKVTLIKTDGFLRCMKLTYDCGGMPLIVLQVFALRRRVK